MSDSREEPHKQFLAFGWSDYYPNGGLCDLIGTFDTIPEAIDAIKKDVNSCHDLYDRIKGKTIDLEMYGVFT